MHPILFHLRLSSFDLPIYGYGTMLGLALLAGWYASVRSLRRVELDPMTAGNVYAIVLVASLLAARLGYLLANLASYVSFGDAMRPSHGGLLGVGAAIGAAAAGAYVARRVGLRPLVLADHAMPAVMTIAFFVRIGCYLYGCDYGRRLSSSAPSWLASLGRFPRITDPADPDVIVGSPAYLKQMADPGGALPLDAAYALPVHPTQLYEMTLAALVFGLSLVLLRRTRTPGDVALPCIAVYGLGRVLVELLRADPDRGLCFGGSITMFGAGIAALAAAIGLAVRARQARDAHA